VIGADFDLGKLELARKAGAVAVTPESLSDALAAVSSAKGADAVIITAAQKTIFRLLLPRRYVASAAVSLSLAP
jgi:D-arabinose 1-dehydrogenase-like Zn-dependent alcohol dehydrogenase